MMTNSKCKICRRAGEKLFLKGEKCLTAKCTLVKKPYTPGLAQSQRKHRSMVTEFGRQLKDKQKVRNMYGMRERQFVNYVREAMKKAGNPAENLFVLLESRVDNVVFRSGFANSRSLARQMVSHGHITVNGRKINIPSYAMKKGDVIGVREGSMKSPLFTELGKKLEKHSAPVWVKLDPKKVHAEMIGAPKLEEASEAGIDLPTVIGFYSR